MKTLLIIRGLPGSGKSTFIEKNNLEPYTLSSDKVRLLHRSPEMNDSGTFSITDDKEKETWKFIKDMLEERMDRGEFIVVDATHLDTNKFELYKQLQKKYHYRVVMVDLSHVDEKEAIRRNKLRDSYKQVPDWSIKRMARKMKTQPIPSWIKVIKPEEFQSEVNFKPIDLSHWKKIHHIGDIQGCYTVLMEYLGGRLKEDELYIFVGDLIDRGIENAEVVSYFLKIYTKSNIILIQGNHDSYLKRWASDETFNSRTFHTKTKPELESYGISKKDVRKLCRKMRNAVYYTYGNKVVLVNHGGLTNIVDDLIYVSSKQLIHGVGTYDVDVDTIFTNNVLDYEKKVGTDKEYYQIHGHRNEFDNPVDNGRCFNLEGGVERGEFLRVVTLDNEGFKTCEVKNTVYDKKYEKVKLTNNLPVEKFIEVLRANNYIQERDNGNGISSFNFNKKVFYESIWNKQTMKARGLHIDVVNNKICGRSYDKFFNLGEMKHSTLEYLEENFSFPVTASIKENGYLGILGYHKARGEFYISSKSASDGKFAEMFKELINLKVKNKKLLKRYLDENNVTVTFEVIKAVEDPHMIEYTEDDIILLDIIKNNIVFEKLPYEEVKKLAELVGLNYRKIERVFYTWDEFKSWYDENSNEDNIYPTGNNVEGYVLEDSTGYHVKIKNNFYSYWKHIRRTLEILRDGNDIYDRVEGCEFSKEFVNWAKDYIDSSKEINIIELRNQFFKM